MKCLVFIPIVIFLGSCQQKSSDRFKLQDEVILKNEINSFINQWHSDAANADTAYFSKIAQNGVYIGTDKTEIWNKNEFQAWSKKYFDSGKAWSFKTISRNIYLSDNKDYAWFDELLDTQMGVCRSSGVLKRTETAWEITHYQLSVTLPNELMNDFIELVKSNNN